LRVSWLHSGEYEERLVVVLACHGDEARVAFCEDGFRKVFESGRRVQKADGMLALRHGSEG